MASILTGTPIPTQGIHPLAAIMGQGADIFGRAYAAASQRGSQNNQISVGFIRDAVTERINAERNALEKQKFEANLQLQRDAMDQRERLSMAEMDSRERMAAARGALGERRSAAGSAAQGAQQQQLAAILGSVFQQGGQAPQGAPQAPQQAAPAPGPQAPIEGPTLPPEFASPQGPEHGPNLPIESYSKADSTAIQAMDKDLSQPEHADALEQAIQRKGLIAMAGIQMSPTVAGQLSYGMRAAESQVQLEQYRAERKKDNADLNGLAIIDKSVAESLSPFDGFTGKKFTTDQDLELAMQNPATAKAINLLHVSSPELKKDLSRSDPSLDELSGLVDQFNTAAATLDTQEKEASFLVADRGQAGSRATGIALAKSRIAANPAVGLIRGHQKVLEEAFNDKIKEADLEQLSPSTIQRARLTTQKSLAAAQSNKEEMESYEQDLDQRIAKIMGVKEWGQEQLNEKIAKEKDQYGEPTGLGITLREEKSRWERARENSEKARTSERALQNTLGRIDNFTNRAGEMTRPDQEGYWDEPRKAAEVPDTMDKVKSAYDAIDELRKKRMDNAKALIQGQ